VSNLFCHVLTKKTLNFFSRIIFMLIFCCVSLSQETQAIPPKKKLIKILSIDGGGIRGIIPALILKNIESRLKKKKHLAECFDVMAGTSTGGIIVLLLNVPNHEGKPKFHASEVVELYRNFGPTVFYKSLWHSLITLNGWFGNKYSAKNLERNMEKYFGDTRLRQTICNILIPAYDISEDETVFFKTNKAQLDLGRDFYFKDIARATSAAPTYFPPAKIRNLSQQKTYYLVDGGVAVNNPTLSACAHAIQLFGKENDFLIVSIGTGTNYGAEPSKLSFGGDRVSSGGKIQWAKEIVPMMMYASNDVVNYQVTQMFSGKDVGNKKYIRFQPMLEQEHTEMDDTDSKNVRGLEKYAEELIKAYEKELIYIASILDNE